MHRHGALFCAYAFEQKHCGDAQQTQKRQHAKVVDVGQDHRLPRYCSVNNAVSLLAVAAAGQRVR